MGTLDTTSGGGPSGGLKTRLNLPSTRNTHHLCWPVNSGTRSISPLSTILIFPVVVNTPHVGIPFIRERSKTQFYSCSHTWILSLHSCWSFYALSRYGAKGSLIPTMSSSDGNTHPLSSYDKPSPVVPLKEAIDGRLLIVFFLLLQHNYFHQTKHLRL